MTRITRLLLVAAAALGACDEARAAGSLSLGEKAPAFTFTDIRCLPRSLADFGEVFARTITEYLATNARQDFAD